MPVWRLSVVLLAAWTACGCMLIRRPLGRGSETIRLASFEEGDGTTVYVVGHGWHTGLVLPTRNIRADILPEVLAYSDSDFLEFGWGDEGFYRAKKITAPLVFRAAFWPTPSVIHVAGIRGSVEQFYEVSDIIEVPLSHAQFDDLCRFISQSFARTATGESVSLGPGLYGDSTFYRAEGKYYVPKTCNTWTAKALKKAGLRANPHVSMTAEAVLSQARRFGRVLQESPRGLKKAALLGTE